MGISAISGLGSFDAMSSIQPMNYAVENESGFSDIYAAETTKGAGVVTGAQPVQYPNAQVGEVKGAETVDPLKKQQRTLEVSSELNDVAMQFGTSTSSYSRGGVGMAYSLAGSRFDSYA